MTRPLQIQIDLKAIVQNAQLARSLVGKRRLVGCVKAEAYGHGMQQVAAILEGHVDALGVACLDEASLLRDAGIRAPILLLEGCFSKDELLAAGQLQCWTVLHNEEQLQACLESGNPPDNIWVKLDTGMHRLGFDPARLSQVIQALQTSIPGAKLQLMTHFACADETQNAFTRLQLEHFHKAVSGFDFPLSLANSAAILAWPGTVADWNRPGFMLYGVNPLDVENEHTKKLQPAMSLTSEVIAVRDLAQGEGVGYNHAWRAPRPSRIAVVACGYGDGYPRQAHNGTPLLIKGQRAGTVGHIAMDMLMADITDLQSVAPGNPVELWGKNLSVAEVARHSGMSPYELLTRIPGRPVRRYIQA